jgi:hypothetical protein
LALSFARPRKQQRTDNCASRKNYQFSKEVTERVTAKQVYRQEKPSEEYADDAAGCSNNDLQRKAILLHLVASANE